MFFPAEEKKNAEMDPQWTRDSIIFFRELNSLNLLQSAIMYIRARMHEHTDTHKQYTIRRRDEHHLKTEIEGNRKNEMATLTKAKRNQHIETGGGLSSSSHTEHNCRVALLVNNFYCFVLLCCCRRMRSQQYASAAPAAVAVAAVLCV